ncbi:MAG: NUDIX domain-containing protein [Desulfobacterales bacterium]|jgi:ADP-ribose pyrophosphatase|nr:NUDIX domain-containing protein [Desulfobacterales bacterium]
MKIIKIKECRESRWFKPKQIVYTNDRGGDLRWDYIERTGSAASVIIVPRFRNSGDYLLIRQYRVIFDTYVIGFPAGITDENETVESAALRELQEETGYSGKIRQISPPITINSALVRETACCVLIEIDDDAVPAPQELEDSEEIEVFRIEESKLASFFEMATERGDLISAGPWFIHMTDSWLKDCGRSTGK